MILRCVMWKRYASLYVRDVYHITMCNVIEICISLCLYTDMAIDMHLYVCILYTAHTLTSVYRHRDDHLYTDIEMHVYIQHTQWRMQLNIILVCIYIYWCISNIPYHISMYIYTDIYLIFHTRLPCKDNDVCNWIKIICKVEYAQKKRYSAFNMKYRYVCVCIYIHIYIYTYTYIYQKKRQKKRYSALNMKQSCE